MGCPGNMNVKRMNESVSTVAGRAILAEGEHPCHLRKQCLEYNESRSPENWTGEQRSGKRTYVGPGVGFFGFFLVFIAMEGLCWESRFPSVKSRLLWRMG